MLEVFTTPLQGDPRTRVVPVPGDRGGTDSERVGVRQTPEGPR